MHTTDLPSNFWHREQFNWAEEVENEIMKTQISASCPKSCLEVDDHTDTAQTGLPRPESRRDIYETELFDRFDEPELFDPFADDAIEFVLDNGFALTCDDTESSLFSPDYYTEAWQSMEQDVIREFAWRKQSTFQYHSIHHFNWLGEGVLERSSTLPEESLAVMLSYPKVPQATDNYRVQAILRRAYTFLDPVLLSLDDVDDSILLLRGSALQHAAKDHVFKYYTAHGQWMFDDTEPIQNTTLDIGEVSTYVEPNVVIGNGFVKHDLLRSRAEFHKIRDDTIASFSPARRGRHWKPSPSRLQTVESIVPVDDQPLRKPVSLSSSEAGPSKSNEKHIRVISLLPTNPVMHPSRDPDVYYTFPPSRIGESKLRRFFRKTWKSVLSGLGLPESCCSK
ncbi:hypothetical protein N7490_002607 [Penicillium lividum]|nr:hypothetical protein N7490_002607 [Penicillium lividum]